MSTSDIKWISARVTPALFIAAKTLCLQRGVSMQKFMRILITKEVETDRLGTNAVMMA